MIGVLALQGCVEPHLKKLASLGVAAIKVRNRRDLEQVSGLILPGGESTTMLKLLRLFDMFEPIQNFSGPVWGICAGAILMARNVREPNQESLDLLPMSVTRNGYGRQLDSFTTPLEFAGGMQDAVFIRAPRLEPLDADVKVLARYQGEPVALQWGDRMVTAFHPEIAEQANVHRYFLSLLKSEPCLPEATL